MGSAIIGESGRSSILPNKKRSREEMENPEATQGAYAEDTRDIDEMERQEKKIAAKS